MNPLWLIAIVPASAFIGFMFGISAGFYFGTNRSVKLFVKIWELERQKQSINKTS